MVTECLSYDNCGWFKCGDCELFNCGDCELFSCGGYGDLAVATGWNSSGVLGCLSCGDWMLQLWCLRVFE